MSEQTSTRDALESAFAEAGEQTDLDMGTEVETPVEPETPVVSDDQPPVQPVEDVQQPVEAEAAPEEQPVSDTPAAEAQAAETPEPEAAPEIKAPASWTPALREKWGEIPADVQAQIDKRERETAQVLTDTAEARKHYERFQQTFSPFTANFAAEGVDVIQGLQNLSQMAATMQQGTPEARAQTAARIISAYGVDLQLLDSILAGQPAAAAQDQNGVMQMVDQRLAPITNWFEQQQQQQYLAQQQQVQQAQQELQTFMESNEFANDVRGEMADLLEFYASRGQQLTYDEAYQRAIQMRPDIMDLIEKRKAQQSAAQNQSSLSAKQKASSSLAGGSASTGDKPAPTDMRSQLMSAIDKS